MNADQNKRKEHDAFSIPVIPEHLEAPMKCVYVCVYLRVRHLWPVHASGQMSFVSVIRKANDPD